MLCERVRTLIGEGVGPLVCDLSAVSNPDAGTLDALAHMQATARALGSRLWLRDACGELVDLLCFVGLSDVLPRTDTPELESLGFEPLGQTEEGEQVGGVEEERDPGDPVA